MSVFKSVFGPTKSEIWDTLRTQLGGTAEYGGFWKGDCLRADVGGWTVTLDEYPVMLSMGSTNAVIPHTRLRAPFPNPRGFRFSIHRSSVISHLGKFFGLQDIEIGDTNFDREFVLTGNNPAKIRQLFGHARLRELLLKEQQVQLSIQDDEGWFGVKYPTHVDVLVFDAMGSIRDVSRLKGLFDLFAETLERLSEMGFAEPGNGGVTL